VPAAVEAVAVAVIDQAGIVGAEAEYLAVQLHHPVRAVRPPLAPDGVAVGEAPAMPGEMGVTVVDDGNDRDI
jgi:hypothetical protein